MFPARPSVPQPVQDRHSAGQASRQLPIRPPGRDSAFGGGKSRAAASRAGGGGQSAFGLQQRMHVPAAIDISGLIAAPAPSASVVADPAGENLRALANRTCMIAPRATLCDTCASSAVKHARRTRMSWSQRSETPTRSVSLHCIVHRRWVRVHEHARQPDSWRRQQWRAGYGRAASRSRRDGGSATRRRWSASKCILASRCWPRQPTAVLKLHHAPLVYNLVLHA